MLCNVYMNTHIYISTIIYIIYYIPCICYHTHTYIYMQIWMGSCLLPFEWVRPGCLQGKAEVAGPGSGQYTVYSIPVDCLIGKFPARTSQHWPRGPTRLARERYDQSTMASEEDG